MTKKEGSPEGKPSEPQRHETTIGLNTWFPFMDSGDVLEDFTRLSPEYGRTGTFAFHPPVLIDTEIIDEPLTIEFTLNLWPTYEGEVRTRSKFVNPFFPTNGYQSTDTDFHPTSQARSRQHTRWEVPLDPIFEGEEQLALDGCLVGSNPDFDFSDVAPNLIERLTKLSLELRFPGGLQVRTALDTHYADGEVLPFDADRFHTPGLPDFRFGLIVPPDPSKLSLVRARIIPHQPLLLPPAK